jgi:DNA-binding beta-propeller fold protein YncE
VRPVRPVLCVTALLVILGGCGGTRAHRQAPRQRLAHTSQPALEATTTRARATRRRPQALALVTAETKNQLVTVDLETGAVTSRITLSAGPQYVAAEPGVAVVTSPTAGAVTILEGDAPHEAKVLRGFGAPHITEISPDGEHAYVTDDARGTLSVIRFSDMRVTSTIHVGAGAHHMSSSLDQQQLWIALGESARTIVILDTSDIDHPRLIGHFDPGFPAHDLSFSPDGLNVWVTSASGPDVTVFRASDKRLLFRVPVGDPPQHVAFDGAYAYLTSGYGSTIEKVNAATGAVITRASAPYGSFELDAADGYVTTASLFNGKLAIYTPQLKLLHVLALAPATRDVAITDP